MRLVGDSGMWNFLNRDNTDPERNILGYDIDGNPLFKDDIISDITDKLEKSRTERAVLELQWQLNARFLAGDQYCGLNGSGDRIIEFAPVHDWFDRETFNMILPLIETRIANLKKINYLMRVKPHTSEYDDSAKADVTTKLLRYVQDNTDFNEMITNAIYQNEICGNVFFLSWWDKSKGEEYERITEIEIDENGEEKQKTEAIYQGDLAYGLVSPYEVFPESTMKHGISSQRYIILEQVKSVEDIYDAYGIKVEGGSVEAFSIMPVNSGNGWGHKNTVMSYGTRQIDNAVKLITYFERPSRAYPDGRMCIMVDDTILFYGKLPYKHIPLVQAVCRSVPGQFFGRSVIEDLIPRQRAYNGCKNRIHEYLKRVALNSYWAQEGSVDLDDYEERGAEPGAILVYNRGTQPPIPVQNAPLPGELMAEVYNLKADMEYVAGTSQLMVNGATPSGVTSGTAIQSLMDIDNTRLSSTGDNLRDAVRKLAIVWLEIYKKYANTRRIINVVGENDIGDAVMWSSDDITSFDVEFTTENELIVSEATQQQNFMQAYQMGLFTDAQGQIPDTIKMLAIRNMKTGDYTQMMSLGELDRQDARRENAFFETKKIIPEVSEFDDHDTHIEEHRRYIKQLKFHMLRYESPQLARQFEEHIKMHIEAKRAEGAQEIQAAMAGMNNNAGA